MVLSSLLAINPQVLMLWSSLSLQESYAPIMELLTYFHDYIISYLLLILGFTTYLFIIISSTSNLNNYLLEHHTLETLWTIVPIFILILIAFPSLYILYLTEDTINTNLNINAVGHQWYWEYQYHTPNSVVMYDSYMLPNSSLRNLEVDNHLALPLQQPITVLVTSADVLHSFTVPSLGVNADAVPGRLNYLTLLPVTPGVFYGQCSELCGTNHSFIPIVVETLSPITLLDFIFSHAS